jgi:HK97 gp10 family phage protein
MLIRVELNGANYARRTLFGLSSKVKQKINQETMKSAINIQTQAKRLCAVDTGRLRSSIMVQRLDKGLISIGTNVTYAPYLEYGTRRQRAQPFLTPAFNQEKPRYIEAIKELTKSNALERLLGIR